MIDMNDSKMEMEDEVLACDSYWTCWHTTWMGMMKLADLD